MRPVAPQGKGSKALDGSFAVAQCCDSQSFLVDLMRVGVDLESVLS